MSDNYFLRTYGSARPTPIVAVPQDPYKTQQSEADLNDKRTKTAKTAEEIQGVQLDNATAAQQLRQFPISKEDAAIINDMRKDAAVATRAQQELMAAAHASDRFRPSPDRAATVNRVLPQEGDGWFDQKMRKVYGWLDGVTQQDITDYQDLERYRQGRVATIQQEQKGPQTDSDAARYMKSTFGPDKTPKINAAAIGEAMFNAKFDELRPGMYTQWANKYGSLSALNKDGLSVDEWYNNARASGWNNFQKKYGPNAPRGAPKNAPRKSNALDPQTQAILKKYGVQ